ncbi:dimethylmenaquinone methyltransferase [Pararhizobium sp. A13]|uniref:RraA family protein n=1 Tax=Pararhizobium sp. A13 TaxID=3133975 RepID=UPI00311AD83E
MSATFDKAALKWAVRLGTSTLFEAAGIATSSVEPTIRTIWSGAKVAGPAFPLECSPGDNLAIHIAMEKAPRGSVLVISASGFIAGYWGEVLTVAAEAAGIVGLVIDGGVRDIAALRARAFPVFARGVSMRGTIKASVASVGQPISLAGTPVEAGDLVVADDDGVLVLPRPAVADTLVRAQARAEKEAAMMEKLKSGQTTLDLLGLSKWHES